MREGHLHEADVVEQLTASGWEVTDRQAEVVLEIGSGKIVGHLDGIIKDANVPVSSYKPAVLEIKAPGKSVFSEVEAMGVEAWVNHHAQYSWQVSGQMWATGRKAIVVVKSRDTGKVLDPVQIDVPPKSIEQFEARMDEIDAWANADRFPPCEKSGFCWKGPYRHIHYKEDAPKDPIPIHETRSKAVEELTEELYKTRQKKKAIEQKESDLKEELIQVTGGGEGIHVTDKFKVTIRNVETTRIDTKKVREEHGTRYDVKSSYPNVRIDHRD